jgi:toxin ParE1/3/4
MLATNPLAERERPELGVNIRSFPVGRCAIFYLPAATVVEVIRVLHGARDITSADLD